MNRTAMRVALLLIAFVLLASVRASTAGAHANLERSEPAENAVLAQSPFEVKLYFSEEPELRSSRVEVLDTSGNRFDNDDLHEHDDPKVLSVTVPALPDGTYTVVWRNISAVDGHPRAGTFAFTVGEPAPSGGIDPNQFAFDLGGPPRWLSALARWIGYASFFLLLGVATFPMFILRPSLRRANVEASENAAARAVLGAAVLAVVAGTILALLMQSWTSGGDAASMINSELRDLAMSTRFGAIWWSRAGLTIAVLLAGGFFMRKEAAGRGPARVTLLFAAIFLPLTIALNGHGAADDDYAKYATGIDWLHLVAAGLWTGGLVQLAIVVPATIAALDINGKLRVLSATIPRFSMMAIVCVATVVFTGVNQWFILLGNVDDTLHSQYGVTLIVKVAIFLPLVGLGAVNLLFMRPAIARELHAAAHDRSSQLLGTFRRAVAAEVFFGVAVLAATGVLTTGSPPFRSSSVSAPEGALVQTQEAGEGVEVTLSVDPGTPGRNTIDFILDGVADDEPIETFLARFTYLDDELGTTEDEATSLHPTHFQLTGGQLGLAGKWEIETIARRAGFDDIIATFDVDVRAREAPTLTGPTPTMAPLPTIVGERVDISANNSTSFDQDQMAVPEGLLTIIFTNNESGIPHNLNLVAREGNEQRSIAKTEIERGPNRQALTLQLPAGTYIYVCDVHPAMQGVLTVE